MTRRPFLLFALSAAALPWLGRGGRAQEALTPRMTTQTPEYCNHLKNEMARAQRSRGVVPGEARVLADEGTRLCDRGQYKAGVSRLRRALFISRGLPR